MLHFLFLPFQISNTHLTNFLNQILSFKRTSVGSVFLPGSWHIQLLNKILQLKNKTKQKQGFLKEWLIITSGPDYTISLAYLVPKIKEAVKNQWVMPKGLRSQEEGAPIGIIWDHLSNKRMTATDWDTFKILNISMCTHTYIYIMQISS